MKIAMYNLTTTCRYGGIETFVWEISRELARRGEEIHIIGGRGKNLKNISGVKTLLFPFWPRNRVPNLGTRFRKLVERWSFGAFALPTVIRGKYDVLHIQKPFDLPFGAIVKRNHKTKLIWGSQGTDFFWGDRLFGKMADAAISCSDFNGREIERHYGIKPVIVYNGIDPEVFRPLPPDGEIQKKLGFFKGENKTLIYAGRLVGWKGLQVLLKAAALMKEAVPIQLLIVGDGEIRPSLEKLSSELGMEKRVFFAGFVPNQDLPRYYSLADVGVFPSLADETFGISLAEAMACGLPVVSTKIGGIPEVVPEGKAGFLVAPKNPQELAEKILFLLADDRLRKNMGEAARQRVLDHFTWAKAADRLLGVYREVGGVIRPK